MKAFSNANDSVPAVFQYESSVARLGGDPQLFREMAGMFLEDSPDLLKQARRGLLEGDAKLVERAAHSIKGLAANFDAANTVAAAEKVERFARQKDLTQAADGFPKLEQQLVRLQEALQSFCAASQ